MDIYTLLTAVGFFIILYLVNNRNKMLNEWDKMPEESLEEDTTDKKLDFVAIWAQRKVYLASVADADIADRLQECFDFMRKVLAEADFKASRNQSVQGHIQSHFFADAGTSEIVPEDQMYNETELRRAAMMFFVDKLHLLRKERITKEVYSKYIVAGEYLLNSLTHQRKVTKEIFEKMVESCAGGEE